MPNENIELIRQKLIDLYLEIKIRKSEEVSIILNLKNLFIAQIVNISEQDLKQDRENLEKIPLVEIIDYIKTSLYIIIQIKLKEELEKNKNNNSKKILEENAAEDYETLLRKEEAEIRQHICVEHQFKLHSENLEQKIMELEDDNYILVKKVVSNINIIKIILQEKQKKKYENQIKDLKNELGFLKTQKNNQKIQEKNLKQKLSIKEKEINELKTILNTNASIRSQISSIYQDQKEEEYSKENEKETKRDIFSYLGNNMKISKKKHKKKSLSLIERKLSSLSSINRRNLLRINYINKSNNSKNNSKKKNSSKKNKNKKISNNHKIINCNNYNSENKYKTIAQIYYSGSNTKRTKNDNSIKITNRVKKSSYYNYNSINSLRQKRLNKSVSRSMLSKRGIEESFTKNYLWNINRSDINSNKNKKILKDKNIIKNKILINYNTNIINTNISLDKNTINKKMKELKNSIEDKIIEITRNKNKKNGIKRTISAFYDKSDKYSMFLDKIKTKRENSFRHKNFCSIDKNNSIKIKKNNFGNGLNYINSGCDSNFFRKKFLQLNTQHKNKNMKKGKKMKIKLKDNSVFNIKNDISKDSSKNKFLFIQAYTGKNQKEERKNNDKTIKNASTININKNIISIKKNPYYETNVNKTLKNNPFNVGSTYRKYKNSDKISVLYDKNLTKNASRVKINKSNITNNTNRINPSLREFIFSKCISNSNIS